LENLNRLLEIYQGSKQVNEIISSLNEEDPSRILIQGLHGAGDCFALSAVFKSTAHSHIYIANDKETAAYIYNSIDNVLSETKVHFFSDSFKRPGKFEELDTHNVLLRTETVNKVSLKDGKNTVIVTYPEALFEQVVDPTWLDDKKILLAIGESLDIDTIIGVLVEYGFERVDFVYEPGQFSLRGGIVDIFSYGNEWPYRIELFDEEIESIRTFNPMNQLSLKNIKKVSIVPNLNSSFKQDQKISLLKVFQDKTIIWLQNTEFLLEKIQECFDRADAFVKELKLTDEEDLKRIFDERAFLYPDDIVSQLDEHHLIFLSKMNKGIKFNTTIDFAISPQPNFNKNFNLLIDEFRRNEKEGISNYLLTDNTRQLERFYSIFEDLDAQVKFIPINVSIHEGFIDNEQKVAVYTDHQIFERFHRYKLRKGFSREQSLNLKMLKELQPGDFVTHIDHGIGKYSGLEKIDINGHIQESIRLIYLNNDILYISIQSLHKIAKYVGKEGTPPRLSKIGGDAWKNLKRKTKKKVKDIAKELIKLYAKRKASKGHAFEPDGYMQNELEASFIYQDTPDQYEASEAVKADMMKEYPMDRLVCGDVGFGKTEVALRATFKAVVGGKQVAVLVPTTILALQHFKTFTERLQNFGVSVDYINRFKTTKQKNETLEKAAEGKLDVLIGTHAILNKKVKFKNLGLLVIDEEQKFGVAAKEKLRSLQVNVDTLTLTATPIPRTLQFSLMAARDLSIIRTPPPNRQPIHTERRIFNDEIIKDSIYYEVNRGGQVFFVHNRVKTLPEMTALIQRLCPDIDIAMAHGQMDPKILEATLLNFIERKYDVLVCTNIIETGLDIPNANTMIINNAHQFGMSDLHQLRGRVGRSNKKAYCYLFAPPLSTLTTVARKRLKTLEEFSDLGSGFHIAMKDLDIRGAGNLLGAEQSGFISDIGYETYQKILEEAILELKEGEFKELFKEDIKKKKEYVRDVDIDTDIEMLIPDDYIRSIQERLNLYTELNKITKEEDIEKFAKNLVDRFGPLPRQIEELFNGLRLRWICKSLGIEKLTLKSRKMRCYFVSNPQSLFYESKVFQDILKYVSTKGPSVGISLKQSAKFLILIKEDVRNLKQARLALENIQNK